MAPLGLHEESTQGLNLVQDVFSLVPEATLVGGRVGRLAEC